MIKEYYKREYNLVNRAWKYIALSLMGFELVIAVVLWSTYDFQGDLNEAYFDFGNKLLMIGVFEKWKHKSSKHIEKKINFHKV